VIAVQRMGNDRAGRETEAEQAQAPVAVQETGGREASVSLPLLSTAASPTPLTAGAYPPTENRLPLPNVVVESPTSLQVSQGPPLPPLAPPPTPPRLQPLGISPSPASSQSKGDEAVRHEQVAVRTAREIDSELDPEQVYCECADRARGVCGKGAVTRRYRTVAYTFCALWCAMCAVLVLAYGVQFGADAAKWLTIWGDAILLDVLLIKPAMIVIGALVSELLVFEMHQDHDMDLDIDMDQD
jgi:hypothetical protein